MSAGRTTSFIPCHWCGKPTRTCVWSESARRPLPRCGGCKDAGKGPDERVALVFPERTPSAADAVLVALEMLGHRVDTNRLGKPLPWPPCGKCGDPALVRIVDCGLNDTLHTPNPSGPVRFACVRCEDAGTHEGAARILDIPGYRRAG